MDSLPFIGRDLVKKHLKYSQLIPAVERALREYSGNRAVHPLRTTVTVPRSNGTLFTMPSYSSTDDILMTKLLGVYPDKVPTQYVYIALFNPDTGELQCMMDGDIITLMRTAAVSVVATQTIVKSQPKVLAILGSGVQARSHIEAFCSVYEFEKINIWGRSREKAQVVCDEFDQLPMQNCETVENAVTDADVIVTVTHAAQPVLLGRWLKEGAHVNCVGACRPSLRECDDDCLRNTTVYADSKESAINESGDVILSKAEVYAEIGEILLEEKPLRSGHHTFFKSLGFALQDAVAAKLAWKGVIDDKAKIN